MRPLTAIQRLNREVSDRLVEEAKIAPIPGGGETFVGITNGKVVVVTGDLDELGRELERADPDPGKSFWFELGRDYHEVFEIGEHFFDVKCEPRS